MNTFSQKWRNIQGACHQAHENQRLEAPLYALYNLVLSEFLQDCRPSNQSSISIYLNPQHTLLPHLDEDAVLTRHIQRRTPDFTGVIAPAPVNLQLSQPPPVSAMLEALALVFGAEVKPLRHTSNIKLVSWQNTPENTRIISQQMFGHFEQLEQQAVVGFGLKKIREKNKLFAFLFMGVFFSLHCFTLEPRDQVKAVSNDSRPYKRRRLDQSRNLPPSENDNGLVLKRTAVVPTYSGRILVFHSQRCSSTRLVFVRLKMILSIMVPSSRTDCCQMI
ncbi:hypothetical protein C8R47DRAFT_677428 [Mycena vitilis]|nr:hypothetical protein C8R47DRAFT_677428 [Mycena vitilis]